MTRWPTKALGKLVLPTEQRDQREIPTKEFFCVDIATADKEFAARPPDIRAMPSEQADSRRRLDDLFHSMLHRAFQREL